MLAESTIYAFYLHDQSGSGVWFPALGILETGFAYQEGIHQDLLSFSADR